MDDSRKYDELVAAIVKAVPWKLNDKDGLAFEKRIHHDDQVLEQPNRPITLEDVLRASYAIGRPPHWDNPSPRLNVDSTGLLFFFEYRETPEKQPNVEWHLGHDLAWHRDNAPETIAFLHSLLTPSK